MTTTQRNFLILGLIAVVGLLFSDKFASGASGISGLLMIAFTVLIVWFGITLYMRNSGTIAQMAATPRLIMQVSCGVLFFLLLVGQFPRVIPIVGLEMPPPFGFANTGGAMTLIFWGGLFASGFGIWWAWQQRTSKW